MYIILKHFLKGTMKRKKSLIRQYFILSTPPSLRKWIRTRICKQYSQHTCEVSPHIRASAIILVLDILFSSKHVTCKGFFKTLLMEIFFIHFWFGVP